MRLLVVGYLEQNSGKTALAVSLVRALKARRRLVFAAKPVAGHSAWHQYETVVNSKRLGLLVGEDAYKLALEAEILDLLPLMNPVDVLITPMDPTKTGGVVEEPLMIALMRVTYYAGGPAATHYICEEVVEKAPPPILRELRSLAGSLRPSPEMVTLQRAREMLEVEAAKRADQCLSALARECEDLVIESFNNAATPTPGSIEVDYVLAVSPGRVDLFEGGEYRGAVNVLASLGLITKLTVGEVAKYLKPLHTSWVEPAVSDFEEAYAKPVEEVLAKIL